MLTGDDVCVLGVHVEEVCVVDGWVPIGDGLAHDDGAKAVGDGVDAGGAHAAAGGEAAEDDGVDAKGGECGGQWGAEEGAGIALGDEDIGVLGAQGWWEIAQGIAGLEALDEGVLELFEEDATADAVFLDFHAGECDGDSGLHACLLERQGGVEAWGEVRVVQGGARSEVGLNEVDHEQGGALAIGQGDVEAGAGVVGVQ